MTDYVASSQPDAPLPLGEAFRRRRISLSTMDRSLRLATAGAFATLAASAILIALRTISQPTIYLGGGLNGVHQVGAVYFAVSLGLLSIGLGYLVTGAELARPIVGVPATALILVVLGFYTGAFGSTSGSVGLVSLLPGWAQWSSRALLALLAAVAVRLGLSERGERGRHEMTSAHTIALVTNIVLFGAYWLTLAIASPTVGHLSVFGPVVNVLLGSLALALYPFLQVAAVDFGDWGQTTVERVGAALAKTETVTRLLAALLGVGIIIYGYQHASIRGVVSLATVYSVARGVLVVAIGWSVLCLLGRVLKMNTLPWREGLGFAPLVAVCAMLTIVIVPLAGLINGNFVIRAPELVTPDGHFAPGADVVTEVSLGPAGPFSVLLPRPWITVGSSNGTTATGLVAHAPVEPGRAEIVIVTNRRATPTLVSLASEAAVSISATRVIGPWTVATTTSTSAATNGYSGLLWVRTVNATASGSTPVSYIIDELQVGHDAAEATRLFEAIGNSVHTPSEGVSTPPAPDEEAPLRHADRLVVWEDGLGLIATVILVGVALAWRGRRGHSRVFGGVLLFVLVVLMDIEVNLVPLGRIVFGADSKVPTIGEGPVYFGIGVLAVAGMAVVWSRGWRRADGQPSTLPSGLIGLAGALAALDVMYRLYTHALQANRVSVWAAIILLIAVTWEVLMSGETMTNFGTRRVPRSSRLLAFLGYTIVLCGGVLFFSAQTTVGKSALSEPFFEPEAVTQAALFQIGLPLFAVALYLRLVSARRQDDLAPSGASGADLERPPRPPGRAESADR